jgi:hypothetical protein
MLKFIIYASSYDKTLPLAMLKVSYEILCFPYNIEVVE